MLLGRAPGFAPGPAVVGPWRPVSLERRRGCVLDGVRLRTRLDDNGTGRLACRVAARALAGTALPMELELSVAGAGAQPLPSIRGPASVMPRWR